MAFWFFGVMTLGFLAFVRLRVPETRGRTLERIEADLRGAPWSRDNRPCPDASATSRSTRTTMPRPGRSTRACSTGGSSRTTPGFVRTVLPPAAEMVAAVQTRRELVPGLRTNGPEVTIEVDDIGVVLGRVEELGGQVVMDRATIPSVGDLAFLTDPSGNVVGVIEYARG